ncbi:Uncharacterised protein [Achromobacter xylosoxidans]|nr:Uncharacterised protein [Achromobacter xylosoxidans]CUJ96952.1 Uncharacterised protein [Achromobacter xylosoxidans]
MRDGFGRKAAWVVRMACCIWVQLALPAQATEISVTPRQQNMLTAIWNTSEFAKSWNESHFVFSSMEDSLRRSALIRRCLPRPDETRLFRPPYRQYVETVGVAFYRYQRKPAGSAARILGQRGTLWAIDQLSEEQYEHSMRLLTAADFAKARAVVDLGWTLGSMTTPENLIDISSGYRNVALLALFKQTLVQTGQLKPVLAALGTADPTLPEAFASLEFLWPVPPDKWNHWQDLAFRLEKNSERIQLAYWASWPEPMRKQVDTYLGNPLFKHIDDAQAAEREWASRMRNSHDAHVDVRTLNDTEKLGRQIYFYFGEAKEKDSDAELLKAYEWLRQQSMAYLDTHKEQLCAKP